MHVPKERKTGLAAMLLYLVYFDSDFHVNLEIPSQVPPCILIHIGWDQPAHQKALKVCVSGVAIPSRAQHISRHGYSMTTQGKCVQKMRTRHTFPRCRL